MKRKNSFKKRIRHQALGNARGIAMFEMIFLLLVFVVLFGLTLGFWGAIHTGTLQSISARHYSFEVLNHRTHYEYHRDWPLGVVPSSSPYMIGNNGYAHPKSYHGDLGMRFFFIAGIYGRRDTAVTTRGLNFFKEINRHTAEPIPNTGAIPGHDPGGGGKRNPLWIKIGYGIGM